MTQWKILTFVVYSLGLTALAFYYGGQRQLNKAAVAYIEAEAKATARQKDLVRGVQKVAEDAEREQQALSERLVSANDTVERLRQDIRDADTAGDTATTSVADAKRARALLAECAGKYRDMAANADGLRATVLGLQAYARSLNP